MDATTRNIEPGWAVFTTDDRDIGEVKDYHADYLHVEHGRLFGRDEYYFPTWTVGLVDRERGRVRLTLSAAELEQGDWSRAPAAGESRGDHVDAGAIAPPATLSAEPSPPPASGLHEHATVELPTMGAAASVTEGAANVETLDRAEVVVPVVEERVDITKEVVELGAVVIERDITEEERLIPVEVAHDEVRIERRAVSREASEEDLRLAAGDGLSRLEAGNTIVLPVIEEVVEVRKRMMVREELVITKHRVTETHEVKEYVRRVEPRISSTGQLERNAPLGSDAS